MARATKKQIEKYNDKAVIIDGDLLKPTDKKVVEAKAELRRVEQGYVDKTVDDFLSEIEKKKEEITNAILDYAEHEMKEVRDDNGEVTGKKLKIAAPKMNEYVINRLFFSSVTPLSSKEPKYNAEKLALVFDLYEHIEHRAGYNSTIVENMYVTELLDFLAVLKGDKEAEYSFEKDKKILGIIDEIEGL